MAVDPSPLEQLFANLTATLTAKIEENQKINEERFTGVASELRKTTEESRKFADEMVTTVSEVQIAMHSLAEERAQRSPSAVTGTGLEDSNIEHARASPVRTIAAAGRPSFMLRHNNPVADPVSRAGAIPVATGTVMVKQEKVHPAMQIMQATLEGLKTGIEHQGRFFSEFDQWKNLGFFFSAYIRRLLAENEHRHGRNMGLTEHGILKLHDDAFIAIFVSYVRVNTMGTRSGFTETICGTVKKLKAVGPDPERPMTIEEYDRRFHAVVNKQIDTLEKVVELAYLGATLEEAKNWPSAGWGKGDMFGLVRILLGLFDPYVDNFQHQIGLENLKAMKTHGEFFAALRKVNNENANRAARLRAEMAEISPMVKLDQIVVKVNDRRRAQQILQSRVGDRSILSPGTLTQPATPGTSHPPDESSAPGRAPVHPVQSSAAGPVPPLFRPNLSYARAAAIEDEGYSLEDTFDSDSPTDFRGYDHRRVTSLPQHDNGWDNSVGYTSDEEGSSSSAEQRFVNTRKHSRFSSSPPDPNKPCFRHWKSKSCPGNCGYDHSLTGMQTYMREQLAELLDSPFTPTEYVASELQKRQPNNQRNSLSLTALSNTGSHSDSSPMPSASSSAVQSSAVRVQPQNSSRPTAHSSPSFTRGSS